MGSSVPQKRAAPENVPLSSRARRRKFRNAAVHTVRRADLSQAQRGVLVSCTPGHEHHAFRDAVVLFSRFVSADQGPQSAQATDDQGTVRAVKPDNAAAGQGEKHEKNALENELAQLRKREGHAFTRVVADVKGAVFLRVNDQSVDVEHVVEQALVEARESGNTGSRHCIRLIPVHATCYAKAESATTVALKVVKERFPPVQQHGGVSFAIVFRARLNNSAKRDEFIQAIASAIHEYEPRYTVNLTKPDVVLIVEVLKTSCCIGTFTKFYQLAKLNLREAACPSKPKDDKGEKQSAAVGQERDAKDSANSKQAGSPSKQASESAEKAKEACANNEPTAVAATESANTEATATVAAEAADAKEAVDGGDSGDDGATDVATTATEAVAADEAGDKCQAKA